MMILHKDLPIYKACYDLNLETIQMCQHLNKSFKYSIGERLLKETIELVVLVYRAAGNNDKVESIQKAREGVEVVVLLVRMLHDAKAIPTKKYIQISKLVDNISRQLNGWHKKSLNLHKVSSQSSLG